MVQQAFMGRNARGSGTVAPSYLAGHHFKMDISEMTPQTPPWYPKTRRNAVEGKSPFQGNHAGLSALVPCQADQASTTAQ
jgi:hypothetical protein